MRSQEFTTMIRSALLCCLFGASLACTAHAAVPDAVPENLVIAGDWPAIVRHLTNVKNVDSVTNFIAGHAFLATDHANEAMCSFAVGMSSEARAAWGRWTSQLAAAHPASAVAHYLEGDAFARNGDWAAARAEFDHALALAPNDPLVLYARALAEAGAGDWPIAQADLLATAGSAQAPIDAQINQAVLAILHRDDASTAGRTFAAVVKRFPNHVIRLIGQGAVASIDHQWEAARGHYRKAMSVTACVPLALDNLLLVQEAELKEERQIAAAQLAQATPGTQV
jgi:tetratricopeptide (TPR) repeat protein